MSRVGLSLGGAYTSEDMDRDRKEVQSIKFSDIKSYEDCNWLTKRWRDLKLAFRMPKSPLPIEMKGFAKRSLKNAIKNSSQDDPTIIIDGKEYRLVEKSRYRRKFNID